MKNLPDKNSTLDSFLEYSVGFYHQELMKTLRGFKLKAEKLGLPTGFQRHYLKGAILIG